MSDRIRSINQALRESSRADHSYRFNKDEQPMSNSPLFLSTDNVQDYIQNEFLMKRYDNEISTHNKSFNLDISNRKPWDDFIQGFANAGLFVNIGKSRGMVMEKDKGFFSYNNGYENTTLNIVGDSEWVEKYVDLIFSKFNAIRCTIEWYYTSDGDSATIKLESTLLPVREMYPWMQTPLEDYYENFMASNANILLLIGPPGTGKTSWIKGLLHHTRNNGIVTYDPEILKRDFVFANFISGEANVMVIEDADIFLKSREDHGNDLMHKFLNIGSGLISSSNKKIIFSTNLNNVRDVDEALIRPGRCYDVLEFKSMNYDEAMALAAKKGVDFNPEDKYNQYTVAEVFNQGPGYAAKKVNRNVGFI